jgi:hypothetical protein
VDLLHEFNALLPSPPALKVFFKRSARTDIYYYDKSADWSTKDQSAPVRAVQRRLRADWAVPVRLFANANAKPPAEHALYLGNEPLCIVKIGLDAEFLK